MLDLAINTTLVPEITNLPQTLDPILELPQITLREGIADFFIFREEFPDFCSLVYSGGLRRDLFVNSWRLKIQVHRVTEKSNGCRFLRLNPRFTFYRLSEEQVFEPEVVD
ncbi:hypothetical protein V6N13_081125 [Hibiscus sabdariffa]|uniref:Uncharacterized protein n=1 Tax=Hibiscus sabdariffa TaxID=183260 RepID=A0ABR2DBK6_9ROSI